MKNNEEFADREFIVIFNEKAKSRNDAVLEVIAQWPEVEKVDYQAQARTHLPENERYDRASVLARSSDDANRVCRKLENLEGVRGNLPPLHCLTPFRLTDGPMS